jgi:enoyl-CoA hydratase/carnithine racemase
MPDGSIELHIQGPIAHIVLSNPKRRNALHWELWIQLADRAKEIAGDSTIRVVVVSGAKGHFCAGMDLSMDNPALQRLAPALMAKDQNAARSLIQDLKSFIQAIADLPIPTIAAIEGACVGGGMEIALGCDLRVAATNAQFALNEARVGMVPDLGGTARLTRIAGTGRATDLILTGRRIQSAEAQAWGVVQRVCEPGQAVQCAMDLAKEILGSAPEAVKTALRTIRSIPDLSEKDALHADTEAGVIALTSGEPAVGIQAFLAKKAPDWSQVPQ